MICQQCNERPATLHFTQVINGEKTVLHLCEYCGKEKGESFMFNMGSAFSINNLLAGLLNMDTGFHSTKQQPVYKNEVLQCPECSMTYNQFVKIGRFGCANCYETFRDELMPLLKRLHIGNWTHSGKIPNRIGGDLHIRKSIDELKQKLTAHISREEFEQAAQVRDEIRALEKQLAQRSDGGVI